MGKKQMELSNFKRYAIIVAASWTLVLLFSLSWNIRRLSNEILRIARIQAESAYETDVIYRRWNAMHGGVYVPMTEKTPSNPFLNSPERDVVTTSGLMLTLMNPAYMTRQVREMAKNEYGTRSSLTSLNPTRSENKPDPWQEKVLKSFFAGVSEACSVEQTDGKEYMRLMRPFVADQGCMKCHPDQRYRAGVIAGGIEVAIPLAPLRAVENENAKRLILAHAGLWLIGLAVIGLGSIRLIRKETEILRAKEEWERTFDAIPDFIAILDNQQRIVKCNKSMAEGLGYSINETEGMQCFFCFHNTNAPPDFCPYLRMVQDGEKHTEEVHIDRLNKDFLVSALPMFDDKGEINGCVHIAHDITELKELSDFNSRIIEESPIGIATYDKTGQCLSANRSIAKMVGTTAEHVLAQNYHEIGSWKKTGMLEKTLLAMKTGKPERQDLVVTSTFGKDISLDCYLVPFGDGKILLMANDITERVAAENALRESEKKLREAQKIAHLGHWEYDLKSDSLYWSDEVFRIYGADPEKFLPTYDFLISSFHPEDRKCIKDAYRAALENHTSFDVEHRIVTGEGQTKYIHEVCETVYDESDKPIRSIGTVMDISERMRAGEMIKRNEERLEALLKLTQMDAESEKELVEYSLEEVVRLTKSEIGYFHFFNEDQISLNLFTWSKGVLNTCTAAKDDHYPLDKAGVWADCVRHKAPIIHNDYPNLPNKKGLPKGHSPVFRHMSVPVYDANRIVAVIGVGNKAQPYDASDIRRMTLFMSSMWQILKRRRVEKELFRARQEAESANRAKSAFLANMSHEIRTPMNPIINMTRLLLETELTTEQRDYAETAMAASDILLSLINDILDFSKIEAGKFELEITEFDPNQIVGDALRIMDLKAEEKGLRIVRQIDPEVCSHFRGDPARVRQILLNFINNAIKFTQAGQITVRVSVKQENADRTVLRFEIEDTGVGIPPERMKRLFKSFSQADASISRQFGGTGLGLAISKQLAELMGGLVGAESEPGTGSVFWFEAGFEKAKNAEPEPAADRDFKSDDLRANAGNLRILLAEDNIFNQKVVLAVLKRSGFSVDGVSDGKEALDALKNRRYDLVLMDVQMPGIDGLQATRIIRDPDSGVIDPQIPIVAMTANVTKEDRENCFAAGMNDYVSKPVYPEELFKVIAEQTMKNKDKPALTDIPSGPVSDIPIFDREKFMLRMGKALHMELIEGMPRHVSENIRKLTIALSQKDAEAIRMAAHALKGLCANASADRLRDVAKEIEDAVKQGETEINPALTERLAREFEAFESTIRQLLKDRA